MKMVVKLMKSVCDIILQAGVLDDLSVDLFADLIKKCRYSIHFKERSSRRPRSGGPLRRRYF